MDRSSSQKINKETTNMKNTTDQMDITVIHCGGAGRLWANTENVFAPLLMKVGSWNEHNKGLWAFTECLRLGTDNKGLYARSWGVQRLLLTTCFWEQGLLFLEKTPFRVSPKLCYGLGGGKCVLCLNALMFIWNGYVQVCLMLYSLKIIKLHNWIINFQSSRDCP